MNPRLGATGTRAALPGELAAVTPASPSAAAGTPPSRAAAVAPRSAGAHLSAQLVCRKCGEPIERGELIAFRHVRRRSPFSAHYARP